MRAQSSAIGTPPSMRTRPSRNSGSPGAMPSSSASSMVAGAVLARSTRDVAARPIRAAVSVKDSRLFGHSLRVSPPPETYQPRPCDGASAPSSTSDCSALRRVTRLMPRSWQSSRSGGRRLPDRSSPLAIRPRRESAACTHSGSG